MIAARTWMLCPTCRVFVDQTSVALLGDLSVRCPWCQAAAMATDWAEAGARDVCECGCPRAAHTAYQTHTGEPPSPGARVVVVDAPCVGCGCVRLAGAREVRA